MKIKLNTNLIVNILIVGFIAFIGITWAITFYFTNSSDTITGKNSSSDITYKWVDNTRPIDEDIPVSVSYEKYLKLRDSTKTIRMLKNGDFPAGIGSNLGYLLATGEAIYCDTCSLKWFESEGINSKNSNLIQYYIKLPGWKIKEAKFDIRDDSVHYYMAYQKAYIRKVIEYADKNDTKVHIKQMIDEPVKFRYSQLDKCIMIPVSKTVKQITTIMLIVIDITTALYLFYLLACFLKFVFDLSKGLSFTDKNIKRLRLIALSFLVYPAALFIFNFFLRLIFSSYFTSDIVLNTDIINVSWKIILAGLVFLALWKAFKQGKLLKEDKELTI